ncbi:MAG TPA: type IX secretion system membrane protein PorP/SprF [Prolixibacteraceae bacterium]|nr:type IX secretion system membrane protein PorP/SprF [Prolixibacteraceae bacterium]
MIKRLTILFLFLSLTARVFAQQDPMYSQYVFNGLLINPAYAGSREVLSATVLYRNQWVNIPGAPKTGVFSLDSPVKNQKVGLGLNMVFDKIGVTSRTSVSGIYSYKLYFEQSSLSFGLLAGVGFFNTNNSEVNYSNSSTADPAFMTDYHMVVPNFGFGMYYHSDRFFAGFSIMNILGSAIQDKFYTNVANDMTMNTVSHFFLSSGYVFDLTPDVQFQPSFLLKYVDGAPLEGDINGVFSFYDLLCLGVSYRSYASVDFLMQVKINDQLSLGYSYEYSTNELSNYTSGSHEIVLRYQFDFSHGKIATPRFF